MCVLSAECGVWVFAPETFAFQDGRLCCARVDVSCLELPGCSAACGTALRHYLGRSGKPSGREGLGMDVLEVHQIGACTLRQGRAIGGMLCTRCAVVEWGY